MTSEVIAAIREAILGTAFAGRTYLVGGFVRDDLLGRPTSGDIDIVLEGDAAALANHLWETRTAQSPPTIYRRFGTAMVTVQGQNVELVGARRESYASDSRKPEVRPATLLEDSQRRDFTVNTLIRDVISGELHDPLTTGLADLNAGVLRTPLNPESTFYDDPLRMLRAVRFKWQLSFEYVPELSVALSSQAARLKVISAERIRDELIKMLGLPNAHQCLRELMEFGLLDQFAPEFRDMVGCEQGKFHHLDVWNHSLLVLKSAGSGDLVLSLAALMHDIGKPSTRTIDSDGQVRFFRHEIVGATMAEEILKRLRFPISIATEVALLVKNHMRLNSMATPTASACRRIIRDLGPSLDRWLALIEADTKGLKPGVKVLDLSEIRARLEATKIETPVEKLSCPLTGAEIMEITGLSPGPRIGKLKNLLLEDILDGRIQHSDKQAARARLMEHLRNDGQEPDVS